MAEWPPLKNAAFTFETELQSQSDTRALQVNPTLAVGDVKVSIDGGAFNNIATLPAATPAGGRKVTGTLTLDEMNGDRIAIQFVDVAGAEWCDQVIHIYTSTVQLSALTAIAANVSTILGKFTGMTSLPDWLRAMTRNAGDAGQAAAVIEINTGGAPNDYSANDSLQGISAAQTSFWGRIPLALFSGITSMLHHIQILGRSDAPNTVALTEFNASAPGGPVGAGTFDPATDSLQATPAAVGALVVEQDASANDVTLLQSLQLANAANAGKVDGAGTGTVHMRDLADTKNRVTAAASGGNRTAVDLDID